MAFDYETILSEFEHSAAGVMLVDESIPFEVRKDADGNPVAVVDATCEFVQGLGESPIDIISSEEILEV